MAMGKRRQRQGSLFIMADCLPQSDGHPFYKKLNSLLAEAGFDRWIEQRCQRFYEQEETRGQRLSLAYRIVLPKNGTIGDMQNDPFLPEQPRILTRQKLAGTLTPFLPR